MIRPVTLLAAKWADIPFADVCALAAGIGYSGLEIGAFGDHFDYAQGASNPDYIARKKAVLESAGLRHNILSIHKAGHCVASRYDPRYAGILPPGVEGDEAMWDWAARQVLWAVESAAAMGVKTLAGFLGSPIWKYWYSYPPTTKRMVDEGFEEVVRRWTPLFDAFDRHGLRLALEVHPSDIAFDFYTSERLLKAFNYRETLGFTLDPSHFLWQGMDPVLFVREFRERIYHVHMKDVHVNRDGRAGALGSFMEFGDPRRYWNLRTLGRGDVNFEELIRELNAVGYRGVLSVEWEDNGMERNASAAECFEFVKRYNYAEPTGAFDAYMTRKE